MRSFHMTLSSQTEVSTVPQRRITTEALVWNEITVLLSYEADWLGLGAAGIVDPWWWSHLELQVLHPVGAPMPLSEDGYWSEFLAIGEAEEAGGPAAVAVALLNEFSESLSWRVAWARWEQRDLFD
jgi:hypothetical protein